MNTGSAKFSNYFKCDCLHQQYFYLFSALYQLIDERNKLWDKMNELNDKSKNTDRLFKNRGGQLLKEEKERKQIARVS